MAEKKVKKEITPVVKGKLKEKTAIEKAAGSFIAEDIRTVCSVVYERKIRPAIRNGITDAICSFVQMLMFGSSDQRSYDDRYRNGAGFVSYNQFSNNNSSYYRGNNRVMFDNGVSRYDFARLRNDDGSPFDRGQIERIISSMEELIGRYGEASVADLMSVVGISAPFTDNDWGWRDCRDFGYRVCGSGYCLDFARPIDIRR